MSLQAQIVELQTYLTAQGHDPGEPDGIPGSKTLAALVACHRAERRGAARTNMGAQNVTPEGRKFLIEHEGSRNDPYQDVAGYWTIGVGHLLTRDELSSGKLEIGGEQVSWRDGLTDPQVDTLLAQDLEVADDAVETCGIELEPHQFDALTSFAFNVGQGAFRKSTLLKKAKAGFHDEAAAQFDRWVYAGGRRVRGLENRRASESMLYRLGKYTL